MISLTLWSEILRILSVLKVLLLALFCSENINELLTHIDA